MHAPKVHCKKVRMRDGLYAGLDEVARSTPGFSGAELANVVNEAAMLAARCDTPHVEQPGE